MAAPAIEDDFSGLDAKVGGSNRGAARAAPDRIDLDDGVRHWVKPLRSPELSRLPRGPPQKRGNVRLIGSSGQRAVVVRTRPRSDVF
jgi:hypothetical protein